jgi:hypothetical protein
MPKPSIRGINMPFLVKFILAVILTELLTELAIKSVLFKPLRGRLRRLSGWLDELLTCGYCFSVWVAFGVVFLIQVSYSLVGSQWVDLGLTALVVHRLSNYLHNFNDKFLDKYYDLRFINSEYGSSEREGKED